VFLINRAGVCDEMDWISAGALVTHITAHANRLSNETSPYLLQHARNPVDWYPWGAEAFEAARREDKPIFLSVGYSTCYWCHVMERECFENPQIAAEMNRLFINIKVDREERPDVDQLYMNAVQVLTRHGGWPMSVFLTPDLQPFYGGTYFPPSDVHGRPGFLTILRAISAAYHERPHDVRATCNQLLDILRQLAEPQPAETAITLGPRLVESLVDRSTDDYDPQLGGFGHAPKFPRQTLLEMLLAYTNSDIADRPRIAQIRSRLEHTLDAMADGGIHDQLGGGFHRYSTDSRWLVPHFEIMLYDQAMLAFVYAESYRQTHNARHARVARGILDFVLREMTSPAGLFYTAFDAEVDAREGANYLWTREEVCAILGPDDANLFNRVYGLDLGPNFADPHHGSGVPDRNILFLPEPLEKVAADLSLSLDQLEARLQPMRDRLHQARRLRKQPLLDTKIITSWNALMIRSLAFAGRVLGQTKYIDAAVRAVDQLLLAHQEPDGTLWRTSREGVCRHDGFLDDYAFLVQALLELQETRPDAGRCAQASGLFNKMLELFLDREDGGFYFTAEGSRDLIVRQKVGTDSPLPSGNAVAIMTSLAIDRPDVARDALVSFAQPLESNPDGMSAMVGALILYLRSHAPIAVEPSPGSGDRPASPEEVARTIVEVQASWTMPDELHIQATILDGFHINSHEASARLIATNLSVLEEAADLVDSIEYPAGEIQRLPSGAEPVRVYAGAVTIAVRFRKSMAGAPPIRMALTYQACGADSCLPTVTKDFEVNAP